MSDKRRRASLLSARAEIRRAGCLCRFILAASAHNKVNAQRMQGICKLIICVCGCMAHGFDYILRFSVAKRKADFFLYRIRYYF